MGEPEPAAGKPCRMQIAESGEQLARDVNRNTSRQGSRSDEDRERRTVHVLHDQAQPVAVAADLEYRDDVGMRKSRGECRLPGEQRLDEWLAHAAARHALHGRQATAALRFRRPREQHLGHDADSEPPHEVVSQPEIRFLHAGSNPADT